MKIFSVFLPTGLPAPLAAEKAVMIRQGFSWPAAVVTPFWALRHGLWLAFAVWLLWVAFVGALITWGHLGAEPAFAIFDLGAIAFGFEADRLREAKLTRSGYLLQGLSLGESSPEAESFYFERRPPSMPTAEAKASFPGTALSAHSSGSDLLGLFPPQETRF